MRIIGVGNDYRQDDAVGLVVARALRAANLPHVTVCEASGDGAALLELWEGAERVLLIDAVCSGAPAGTLHRIDANRQPMPACFFRHSTHTFGVAEAIELARALGRLPARLLVCGIEGQDFGDGTRLSEVVRNAVPDICMAIEAILARETVSAQPPNVCIVNLRANMGKARPA